MRADNSRLTNHLQTCIQMNEMLLKYRFSLISYLNECPIGRCHQSHRCHHSFDLIHHIQQLEELFQPARQQIQTIFISGLDKAMESLDIELKSRDPQEIYSTDNCDNRVTVNDVTAIQDMDTGSDQFVAEDQYSDRLETKVSADILSRPERSIHCEVKGCHKFFSSRNSLCIHIHRYHKNAHNFECFNCKKCFAFRSLLRKHQMSCNSQMSSESSNLETSDEQMTLIQRNACRLIASNAAPSSSYMIPSAHNLLTHSHLFATDIHSDGTDESNENFSDPKQEVLVCEAKGCHKTLSSKNSLNIHLSRFHKSAKLFECFQCKQCFTNRCLLRNHQSVSQCSQTITKEQRLALGFDKHGHSGHRGGHHCGHHSGHCSNSYMIDVLSRDSKHKSSANATQRKIVCEVKGCETRLSSHNSLNIHISRFHKNADCFECYQCKQCFADRSSLKRHQTTDNCRQLAPIGDH